MKKIFILRSWFHFKLGMFLKLPSIWFWGVKLGEVTNKMATVYLPYNWRSQNPFKSIYFSAQAGAAELSTGLLVLQILNGRTDISMLVISAEIKFFKKATTRAAFTCSDGLLIQDCLAELVASGDADTVTVKSNGVDLSGEIISEMKLTWSFKKR